ncbi:MAG: DUF2490 domain-containing protein [Flavobacteriales bacterium]|nr:DUF2490 domain-containing protein [Flavobacteriales bacterium]
MSNTARQYWETNLKYLVILLVFWVMDFTAVGQNYQNLPTCFHCDPVPLNTNDWGLIFQGTISKKFTDRLKGELNQQTRVMNQFSSLSAIMLESGIKVKLNNRISLKSAFRFTQTKYTTVSQEKFSRLFFRLHVAGYYVWHKENIPIRVQFRSRLEDENYQYIFVSRAFWRNRIKVAYNFKQKLKPYTSFEIFKQAANSGFINFYRYEAGVKWETFEKFNLTVIFRHEYNFGSYDIPSQTQAFGLMANWSI